MAENPDKIGEFQAFYYLANTDTDLTQSDTTILGLAWKYLCIVSLDVTNTFAEHVFNDTCSPDIETVAPGRRQVSLAFELNKLRHSDADIQAWHTAVDSRQIMSVLALTATLDDADAYGWVGNVITTQADETNPQEGPMTESYTWRPAARSTSDPVIRRIYGSGIP